MSNAAQDHAIPAATVRRYLKMQALAAEGSGATAAERSTAKDKMRALRQRYPGISLHARIAEAGLDDIAGSVFDTGQGGGFFGSMFGAARDVMAEVQLRQHVQDRVAEHSRAAVKVDGEMVAVALKLPADVYAELRHMTGPERKSIVVEALAARLLTAMNDLP